MIALIGSIVSVLIGALALIAGLKSGVPTLLIAGGLLLALALALGIKSFGELDRLWSGE